MDTQTEHPNTEQPVYDGDYVVYGGRRMLRVRGAEAPAGAPPAAAADDNGTPPPEGGAEGEGGTGFYDLSEVPPHLRTYVEAELKKIEGNVTPKFQEAAEFRKQWEPFAETGVADLTPDEVKELVEFRSLIRDEDAFREWHQAIAKEFGWENSAEPDDEEGSTDDEFDFGTPDDDEMPAWAKQLSETVSSLEQQLGEQRQKEQVSETRSAIERQLAELHEKHGDFDDEMVAKLALSYDTPDAIQRGFNDYQKLTATIEQDLVTRKVNQPPTPDLGGAIPAGGDGQPKSFEEASRAAVARIKASSTP